MKQLNKQALRFDTIQLSPLPPHKKIFFASDFHLGSPDPTATRMREKKIVSWLDSIQQEAHALFLLGDIFDFWFEYKHVVPKGFARLQGKLASMTDQHIPVYLLAGNHDLWLHDYFLHELNLTVLRGNITIAISDKKFLVGHGDELGSSKGYKMTKKFIYNSPVLQWLFSKLHPSIGIPLARYVSNKSRCRGKLAEALRQGEDPIFNFCKKLIEPYQHHDFYIFGHLHRPYQAAIHETSAYYNLGDWINHFTYGVFDGRSFKLLQFA